MPLVGVWVAGVLGPANAAVWAACLAYHTNANLPDKVAQPDASFLLLLFPQGRTYHSPSAAAVQPASLHPGELLQVTLLQKGVCSMPNLSIAVQRALFAKHAGKGL